MAGAVDATSGSRQESVRGIIFFKVFGRSNMVINSFLFMRR
jgi:hypothetical protein